MVMGEEFEWFGIFWRRYFWRRRYFWWKFGEDNGRMENLVERKGRKEKGKRKKEKKMKKGRYFLGRKSTNNDSGGFPEFSCGCGNLSEKYRNRPKIKYLGTTRKKFSKIKNIILRIMVKSVLINSL